MIQLSIQLGPTSDRAGLVTAIADLQAQLRTHVAFNEPEEAPGGWVAAGTLWARTERQRIAEEIATIRAAMGLLRVHQNAEG